MRLIVFASIMMLLSTAQAGAETSVVIAGGPDDGLSLKLLKAIGDAFQQAPGFKVVNVWDAGALKVSLRSNVRPRKIGDRYQVRYIADFVILPSRTLGSNEGICWEDTLADCADQALKSAQVQLSVNQP